MATDFNKLIYKTVETYMKNQLGAEAGKMDKMAWRKFMDDIMKHFAGALIAMVSDFSTRQVEMKKAAEAEKELLARAEKEDAANKTAPPATALSAESKPAAEAAKTASEEVKPAPEEPSPTKEGTA